MFARLHQNSVHHIHGVPGDYTLKALDHLSASGVEWIGNCNELNAGYAADGYARIRGLAALFTTFGVGELSAINAVAGSFAEHVPVVHIVGTPARHLQAVGAKFHHSLGDGRSRVFKEIYERITVAQANLVDMSTGPEMIDRTIEECLKCSKPVYIELPCDMVTAEVPVACLAQPLGDTCLGVNEHVEEQQTKYAIGPPILSEAASLPCRSRERRAASQKRNQCARPENPHTYLNNAFGKQHGRPWTGNVLRYTCRTGRTE